MLNGFYRRSLLTETIVSNISRGKLLTRLTDKVPDYTYYFDEAGKLSLVCRNPETQHAEYTLVENTGNCEFTLGCFRSGKKVEKGDFSIVFIGETRYENGRPVEHNEFWFSSSIVKIRNGIPENYELEHEVYEYDDNGRLLGGKMKRCHAMGYKALYSIYNYDVKFVYDEVGDLTGHYLNGDEEVLYRVPPQLEEIITGKKAEQKKCFNLKSAISKAMRAEIKEWEEDDIYAVLLFVNHDGEDVVDFAISYNAESDCHGAGSADEERWNYADWRQDEENFMWILEESRRQITYGDLLNTAAEVAADLQTKNILKKKFKRPIPIIIHGYEYGEDELEATRKANPNGEATNFFRWISADFGDLIED